MSLPTQSLAPGQGRRSRDCSCVELCSRGASRNSSCGCVNLFVTKLSFTDFIGCSWPSSRACALHALQVDDLIVNDHFHTRRLEPCIGYSKGHGTPDLHFRYVSPRAPAHTLAVYILNAGLSSEQCGLIACPIQTRTGLQCPLAHRALPKGSSTALRNWLRSQAREGAARPAAAA